MQDREGGERGRDEQRRQSRGAEVTAVREVGISAISKEFWSATTPQPTGNRETWIRHTPPGQEKSLSPAIRYSPELALR